jgi:hypothetical protein
MEVAPQGFDLAIPPLLITLFVTLALVMMMPLILKYIP